MFTYDKRPEVECKFLTVAMVMREAFLDGYPGLRERIEREFLALVLNKNEVIDLLQIKPKALHNKDNQKLLEYAIECYKTNHSVI